MGGLMGWLRKHFVGNEPLSESQDRTIKLANEVQEDVERTERRRNEWVTTLRRARPDVAEVLLSSRDQGRV
jgi:hypothetical protein